MVRINIDIPKEIHTQAKVNAAKLEMNLKDYLIDCIRTTNLKFGGK